MSDLDAQLHAELVSNMLDFFAHCNFSGWGRCWDVKSDQAPEAAEWFAEQLDRLDTFLKTRGQ